MQSMLSNTIHNISHAISEAVRPTPAALVYSRADIVQLEESERVRRMHNADAEISQSNAAKSAALIKSTNFPYFKGSSSGFKRVTARLEEHERARRMLTKPEAALRKSNANLSAGMIRALGWPFYNLSEKQGPHYVYADETSLLEEQERADRINNPLRAQLAKNNAALVANALRWGWNGQPLGSKRFTRAMEEKERARRLTDREGLSFAAEGAYQQAGIIRNLGRPFYAQGSVDQDTASLERQEQARRLKDKDEQVHARQHASIVSRLLPMWASGKSLKRAEQERTRRLSDVDEQQRSIEHARQVSTIVAGTIIDQEVERERIRRMKHAAYDAERAREVAQMINSLGLQFTKHSASHLYEKEARRRTRDPAGERVARANAKKVSDMISALPAGSGWDSRAEEEERKQRMYDRATQQTAKRNARKASDMIKAARLGQKKSPYFQMEKERHRRMVDASQQLTSIANAKKVAGMIRNLSASLPSNPSTAAQLPVAPESSAPRSAPADYMPPAETLRSALPFQGELLEKRLVAPPSTSLPFKNELLQHAAQPQHKALPFADELLMKRPVAPPATSLPFKNELLQHTAEPQHKALPFANELLEKRHVVPPATLPFKNELLHRQPAVSAAPISSIPEASAPRSAPLSATNPFAAPMMAQPTPMMSQPAPMMTQPSPMMAQPAPMMMSQPVTSVFSAPQPITYTSVPVYSAPVYSSPVMSAPVYYSAAGTHVLSDAQRHRLEKQALKHNRKAERDNRRAEKLIVKAEKLHARGKDSRAVKKENKAEQKVISSKQHAIWANDLISKNAAAPIAPAPVVFRPAM